MSFRKWWRARKRRTTKPDAPKRSHLERTVIINGHFTTIELSSGTPLHELNIVQARNMHRGNVTGR